MKYGHEYSQVLAGEGFPDTWVSSAIAYRELKKCIKKVQQELNDLGLDAETLQTLPNVVFGVDAPPEDAPDSLITRKGHTFVPELWVALDKESGSFIDAGLTSETVRHFGRMEFHDRESHTETTRTAQEEYDALPLPDQAQRRPSLDGSIQWVHVPLTAASTFFDILDPKLTGLDALQRAEEKRLRDGIISLGNALQTMTEPVQGKHGKYRLRDDVDVWRHILALYIDSTVFFSSHEQDHGPRSFSKAKHQLATFSDKLVKQDVVQKFRNPKSAKAFASFVAINLDILKAMHFQELNMEAVRKILKKFDKRTALGAAKAYQGHAMTGPFAKSIATDMCAVISSNIVSIVPQMDDYMCPICCDLAWRPIRLGCCNSVYCIRCVIHLQREDNDKCPMCRQPSVMAATAAQIDLQTARYLLKYFPDEVKQRQKANERAAGVDKYGEDFYKKGFCSVM